MLMAKLKSALAWAATVSGLALLWVGFVSANSALFKNFELNPNATLVYLPAALRVIYPMVFGRVGVVGIVIGSYASFPSDAADGPIDSLLLALLSALAPLVGIALSRMLFKTRSDLADLMPVHLLVLAVMCATSNAAILNLYLGISGDLLWPLRQVATILIGDITGTVIVLAVTSFILTFFISRRQV